MKQTLAQFVAAQLRAELGRRRINQAAFAVLVGESEQWVSRRLREAMPIGLDELEHFAEILELPLTYFLSRPALTRDA